MKDGFKYQFASDNVTAICPEAWQALEKANTGYEKSYGEDSWSARADRAIQDIFEADCSVFYVFNGTAANALSLAALGPSYSGVICHPYSHVITDECNAPGFFTGGASLLPTEAGPLGKITPEALQHACTRTDMHYPKITTLSITQTTEVGTVYTIDELQKLTETAKSLGLKIHMDGARLANALAALNVTPKEMTHALGIDMLSFGGTKNGGMLNEAVIFFDPEMASSFLWQRKQGGQLASKMRFMTAPWVGLLENGAWLRYAEHANNMARTFAQELTSRGHELAFPVEANEIFVKFDSNTVDKLKAAGWYFYYFDDAASWRLVCSWNTQAPAIDTFIKDLD